MPAKLKEPEYDLTDVTTLLRMANGNTVLELIALAHYKRDSPISGDAIWCYTHADKLVEALAETPKVRNNEGMDENTTFTTSEHTLYSTALHHVVPLFVDVTFTDVDFTGRFIFDEFTGAYLDEKGNALTVEWDGETVKSIEVPESI